MTISRPEDGPGDPSPSDTAKVRRCLRCRAPFPSEWAGERVCSRCKRSAAWSTGALLRPGLSGAKR